MELLKWFRAIWMMCLFPNLSILHAQEHLGLNDAETFALMGRIREALQVENRTQLLAGLDDEFCGSAIALC